MKTQHLDFFCCFSIDVSVSQLGGWCWRVCPQFAPVSYLVNVLRAPIGSDGPDYCGSAMSWIIKWVLCRGDYWFLFNKFTSFWGAAHLHIVTVKKVHCAELAVTATCWPCPWPWPIDQRRDHSKLVSCCFCNFSSCHRLRRYVRRRGDIIRNVKIPRKIFLLQI